MSLLKYDYDQRNDPFSALDTIFNRLFRGDLGWLVTTPEHDYRTADGFRMDLLADDNTYTVVAELPGLSKEELDIQLHNAVYNVNVYLPGVEHDKASITVDNNTITVEAERSPHWKGRGRFVQREIQAAAYRLHLELNVPVDSEKIVAKSKNGILTIHLPVAEKAKPKKITIQ